MDYSAQAQRWHDTDHGSERGKPLRKTRFIHPREDDFDPDEVPAEFQECWLCVVGNPYWSRAVH